MKQKLTYEMHPVHRILYCYLQDRINNGIGSIRKTSIELDNITIEIDAICKIIFLINSNRISILHDEKELNIYKTIENRLRNCKKEYSDRLSIEYHNLTLQFDSLNKLFKRLGCIGDK